MTAIKSFHPLVIVSKFFFSFSHSSTIFILGIGMCTQLFWDINFSIQRTSPKLDSPYHPKNFDFFSFKQYFKIVIYWSKSYQQNYDCYLGD